MTRELDVRRVIVAAGTGVLLMGALAALLTDALLPRTFWSLTAIGLLITAAVLFPLFSRYVEIVSTWGLVVVIVTLGAGVRGIAIALGYPDNETVQRLYVLGKSANELWGAGLLAFLSVLSLGLGFVLAVRQPVVRSRFHAVSWRPRTVGFVVATYALIGFFATLAYARAVGGLSASIGERRTVIPGLDVSGGFTSYGHFEVLSRCGQIAVVVLMVYWLRRYRRLGIWRTAVVGVLISNALLITLITTTRADVVTVALSIVAVVVVVGRRLPLYRLVAGGVATLIAIAALTGLRTGSLEPDAPARFAVESVLLNRNAYDLGKTVQIIDAVPEALPYEHGRTIALYAIAPIPRAVWPSKPIISPGPVIGSTVYGTTRSGVPPGFTAELTWNFGWAAVVPISLLLGIGLGALERRTRPVGGEDIFAVAFYVLIVLFVGRDIVGVSIGRAFSSAAQTAALLVPVWILQQRYRMARGSTRDRGAKKIDVTTVGMMPADFERSEGEHLEQPKPSAKPSPTPPNDQQ